MKRDGCGGYFLVIVTDYENVKVNSMSGKVAGFDFGLKCFITSSVGSKLESPQYLKQELSKLKKLSKQCSKKKKGSSGQKKPTLN